MVRARFDRCGKWASSIYAQEEGRLWKVSEPVARSNADVTLVTEATVGPDNAVGM
jgi:hypothetical protein